MYRLFNYVPQFWKTVATCLAPIFFLVLCLVSQAQAADCGAVLDPSIKRAQEAAQTPAYETSVLKSHDNSAVLVLVGERDFKSHKEKQLGRKLVQQAEKEPFYAGNLYHGTWGEPFLQALATGLHALKEKLWLGKAKPHQLTKEMQRQGRGKDLLANHRPGRLENLRSLLQPAAFLSCGVYYCTFLFEQIQPGVPGVWPTFLAAMGTSYVLGGHVTLSEILGRFFAHHNWYQKIFFFERLGIRKRNETMAQNITKALGTRSSLVVVVDQKFHQDLQQLLRSEYGFTPLE